MKTRNKVELVLACMFLWNMLFAIVYEAITRDFESPLYVYLILTSAFFFVALVVTEIVIRVLEVKELNDRAKRLHNIAAFLVLNERSNRK